MKHVEIAEIRQRVIMYMGHVPPDVLLVTAELTAKKSKFIDMLIIKD